MLKKMLVLAVVARVLVAAREARQELLEQNAQKAEKSQKSPYRMSPVLPHASSRDDNTDSYRSRDNDEDDDMAVSSLAMAAVSLALWD